MKMFISLCRLPSCKLIFSCVWKGFHVTNVICFWKWWLSTSSRFNYTWLKNYQWNYHPFHIPWDLKWSCPWFWLGCNAVIVVTRGTKCLGRILITKPTRSTNFSNLFLEWNCAYTNYKTIYLHQCIVLKISYTLKSSTHMRQCIVLKISYTLKSSTHTKINFKITPTCFGPIGPSSGTEYLLLQYQA